MRLPIHSSGSPLDGPRGPMDGWLVEMSGDCNARANGRLICPFTPQTLQNHPADASNSPQTLPKAMFELEWIVFIQNTQD